MKKIIFACIEKNIGDDLFIYSVCSRYKNILFYIDKSAQYGDLAQLDNLKFSKILNVWNRLSVSNPQNNIKKILKKILMPILELFIGKNNIVIYIVGNAFKNKDYKGPEQLMWLRDRERIAKYFYLLSTNFGPYKDSRWKNDCLNEFKKMTDVCFRDFHSYKLFRDDVLIRYSPDAVLTLKPEYKCNKNNNIVIISMIDCKMSFRGSEINKIADDYENKLVEISKYYISNGLNVVLLTSNNKQDLPAAKRIINLIDDKNISIFEYNGNFKDVFKLYSKAKYVISTRLHTMILSWIYDIPVLPIVYDIKVKNLIETYNFNNLYIDIFKIKDFKVKELDSIFNNYQFDNCKKIKEESSQQFIKLDQNLIGE